MSGGQLLIVNGRYHFSEFGLQIYSLDAAENCEFLRGKLQDRALHRIARAIGRDAGSELCRLRC